MLALHGNATTSLQHKALCYYGKLKFQAKQNILFLRKTFPNNECLSTINPKLQPTKITFSLVLSKVLELKNTSSAILFISLSLQFITRLNRSTSNNSIQNNWTVDTAIIMIDLIIMNIWNMHTVVPSNKTTENR